MSSISLFRVLNYFPDVDQNKDGVLDRQEMARFALLQRDKFYYYNGQRPPEGYNVANTFADINPTQTQIQGFNDDYRLFATILAGGANNQGLFIGNENKVSRDDFTRLAQQDSSKDSISADDFKAMFPTIAGQGGEVDINQLRTMYGQAPVGGGTADNPTTAPVSNSGSEDRLTIYQRTQQTLIDTIARMSRLIRQLTSRINNGWNRFGQQDPYNSGSGWHRPRRPHGTRNDGPFPIPRTGMPYSAMSGSGVSFQ